MPRTRARIAWLSDVAQRTGVERYYRDNPPPIAHGAEEVLVVEGLWDNPNHWLRLWMFLHAYLAERKADVIGVLRANGNWNDWRQRRSLQALGIRRFAYLPPSDPDAAYRTQARDLLAGARTLRDMLNLKLPDALPAYVFFDTVLKDARHPQPEIEGNGVWEETLAETLRLGDFYRLFFDRTKVVGVVSSHAWKSEWAALCWTALRRNIPFHYMTAHYDSVRIRRMRSLRDYRAPNEHLSFAEFSALPSHVQESLIARGKHYLEERFNGNSDFIVMRYSVRPEQRNLDRASLLARHGLDPEKPLAVVYAHSWFDFPHTQAMTNFTEPLDWIKFTVERVKAIPHVNWALKPHPCDQWYAKVRLQDFVSDLPDNVSTIPEETDFLAIQSIADAVVTIQGSIAIEGGAIGKTVVCADRGMYSDWGFTHSATSREHYAGMLEDILALPKPTQEQSRRAMAYAATALAPPPPEAQSLRLTCDTRFLEGTLYPAVKRMLSENRDSVTNEIRFMREWMCSPCDSYNVWRTLRHYSHAEQGLAV